MKQLLGRAMKKRTVSLGYSLIELTVTLGLLVIVVALAVSAGSLLNRSIVRSEVENTSLPLRAAALLRQGYEEQALTAASSLFSRLPTHAALLSCLLLHSVPFIASA